MDSRIIQYEVNRTNGRAAYHNGQPHPVINNILETVAGMDPPEGVIDPSPEYEIWADRVMQEALDIPAPDTVRETEKKLETALNGTSPTKIEYYDDQSKTCKPATLPYNREETMRNLEILLASGDNSWLEKPFSHTNPETGVCNDITGREILARISCDLEYPEHLAFAYKIACAIPQTDPYWKNPETARGSNPESSLFPDGGPSNTNVLDFGHFLHNPINPKKAVEHLLLLGALFKKGKELHPEKPDPLNILRKANEVYDPQKMLEDLEKKCPGGKKILTHYAERLNLIRVANEVEIQESSNPGFAKKFYEDMLVEQCLATDPRDQPENAVGRITLQALKPRNLDKTEPVPG